MPVDATRSRKQAIKRRKQRAKRLQIHSAVKALCERKLYGMHRQEFDSAGPRAMRAMINVQRMAMFDRATVSVPYAKRATIASAMAARHAGKAKAWHESGSSEPSSKIAKLAGYGTG